ncbi:MAG: arginine--tRNA ligase [Candidatus Pacebacteria bacterium]|nr:arginine--tRNA ligase [Candidatus Paceibacterota bacterium]
MIKREIEMIIYNIVLQKWGDLKEMNLEVENPKQKDNGDYSSNAAMVLSKRLSKNPREIAEEIVAEVSKDAEYMKIFSKVEIAGPGFVNFYISDEKLFENVLEVLDKKEKFGKEKVGEGKTVIVDYSSINIAKPMHVGHLRSTIIGQALYNIYESLGYKVIGDNHIGDWGTQFGKMIYAYKNWGNKKIIARDPIEEMTKLYVRFHKEAEENKILEDLAREETKKLQNGDDENTKIWKFLVRESLKDAGKTYKMLNVKFDYTLGESFYNDNLKGIVEEAMEKNIAQKSEGAVIVNLDKFRLPPFLIQKSDGAYLYTTTDLAAAKYRKEKFKADKILYVVSNEQALHFEQLIKTVELLGYCDDVEMKHIKFGMVLGEAGKKFSTRKGDTVRLEELISRAVEIAKRVVEEKNPSLSQKEKKKIARTVGVGAVKYNDLSQNRMTDIAFNWEKMLSFDGNSAPYLQYTYARINSLREKYKKENKLDFLIPFKRPNMELLKEEAERDVLRQLIKYSEAIENAASENSPHLVALYVYNLASGYNVFYNSLPILKADKDLGRARIALSDAVGIVIKNGLEILGIDVLERM